jgi:hypothetical protein
MRLALLVEWCGLVLLAMSLACHLLAFLFVAPGRSVWAAIMRNTFQSRADFNAKGWRLIVASRLIGVVGALLFIASIYLLGARDFM